VPLTSEEISRIANSVFESEEKAFNFAEVIFTDEETITGINKKHLDRDYITDIITFSYHEGTDPVEGSLYCCAQRIYEQASEFGTDIKEEFARILIHGFLHLCGYDDETTASKSRMTEKENFYLSQLKYL